MKYLLYKSVKHKKIFLKFESKYFVYKSILKGLQTNLEMRYRVACYLHRLGGYRVKFKRRCIITGFNRSFRKFLLSRMSFRELASFGNLTGVRKSSW